jgi:hypothetical protein
VHDVVMRIMRKENYLIGLVCFAVFYYYYPIILLSFITILSVFIYITVF